MSERKHYCYFDFNTFKTCHEFIHLWLIGEFIPKFQKKITQTNSDCPLHNQAFNPSLRLDYSQRSYGKDVLECIGEYSIQEGMKPKDILTILRREYDLPISLSTVARMCNDILVLTTHHIDQNTYKIIKQQDYILVAFDGQEPDGDHLPLWNFTDLISGRVLMTKYFERVDYHVLHESIEEIIANYKKPIIGFVNDKQGPIRKCLETFYPEISHQYCTFHFSNNLWNHLEKYANTIQNHLLKTVKGLYIHKVSTDIKIKVPHEPEPVSLKQLCASLDKEIQKLVKNQNLKFEKLRGITSFDKIKLYIEEFRYYIAQIPVDDRFSKIMSKTLTDLESGCSQVEQRYKHAKEGLTWFKSIHTVLWKDNLKKDIRIRELDNIFTAINQRTLKINSNFKQQEAKSFLPSSKTPFWKILCEWNRLWRSYKPKLGVWRRNLPQYNQQKRMVRMEDSPIMDKSHRIDCLPSYHFIYQCTCLDHQ
ncbi:MAG: hypothetical protein K9W44_14340 [Candidatus Lokiarchaeota archaeon]|nr:hypothetical protein [Candidatus Harpocratesius repetitus]